MEKPEKSEEKVTGQEDKDNPTPAETTDGKKADLELSPELLEDVRKLGDNPEAIREALKRADKTLKWESKINAEARQAAADKKLAEEDRQQAESLKKEIEDLKAKFGTQTVKDAQPEPDEIEKAYRSYVRELGHDPDQIDMTVPANKAWVREKKDYIRLQMAVVNLAEHIKTLSQADKEKAEEQASTKLVKEWDAEAIEENEAYKKACEGPFGDDAKAKVWEFLNSNAEQVDELMKTAKGREQVKTSMMGFITSKEKLWKRLSETEGDKPTSTDTDDKKPGVMAPAGKGLTGGKPPKAFEDLTEEEQVEEFKKKKAGKPTPYFNIES